MKFRPRPHIHFFEEEIYNQNQLIRWINRACFGLPDSEHLLPAVKAFYSLEEAEFLTGMPFKSTALEALAELKAVEPSELAPQLDALARRGRSGGVKREIRPITKSMTPFSCFYEVLSGPGTGLNAGWRTGKPGYLPPFEAVHTLVDSLLPQEDISAPEMCEARHSQRQISLSRLHQDVITVVHNAVGMT